MRRSFLGLTIALLVTIITLSGCSSTGGSLSEREVRELLPDTILNYEVDGASHTQDASSIEIVRADVTDETQMLDCEITLEDDDLTRTVYAELNFKKYETGGWQLEWWSPYQDEAIVSPPSISSADADTYMAQFGYSGITAGEERSSDPMAYERSYEVNEQHSYCDFTGTAVYQATLQHWPASSDSCAQLAWSENADFSGVQTTWKIAGHWGGVESSQQNDPYYRQERLPYKFEFDLQAPDDNGVIEGSGAYSYPAVYPGQSEYTGKYGEYEFVNARSSSNGSSPADATMQMLVNTVYETIVFNFTPNSVQSYCDLLDYTCEFTTTHDGQASAQPAPGQSSKSGETTSPGQTSVTPSEPSTSQTGVVVKPMDTGSDGYILPNSDTHAYTTEELSGLSTWELYLARNEIPARHGYIFTVDDLNTYFGSKSWYEPTLTSKEFKKIEGILNSTEEQNVQTILDLEKSMDSPYAPKPKG